MPPLPWLSSCSVSSPWQEKWQTHDTCVAVLHVPSPSCTCRDVPRETVSRRHVGMPLHVTARGLGSDDDACTCVGRTWRRCGDRRGRRTDVLASTFRDVQQETRSRIPPIRLDAHPQHEQERGKGRTVPSQVDVCVSTHHTRSFFSRLSSPMPCPSVQSTRAHVARRTPWTNAHLVVRAFFTTHRFTTLSSQRIGISRSGFTTHGFETTVGWVW